MERVYDYVAQGYDYSVVCAWVQIYGWDPELKKVNKKKCEGL